MSNLTFRKDSRRESLENEYLSLQLSRVLEGMEALPGYTKPIVEVRGEDTPISFQPVYAAPLPTDFVLTDVLVLSRKLRTSGVVVHKVASEFELVANQLNVLSWQIEAINVQKIVVQLYRNLVAGGCLDFLPYLAHSLKNLSVNYQNAGWEEEGLQASEDSIAFFRLSCETFPNHDFKPLLAMALRTHGDALALSGDDEKALSFLEDSVQHYNQFWEETQAGTRQTSFTDLFSSVCANHSYSKVLYRLDRFVESLNAGLNAALYFSYMTAEELALHNLRSRPYWIFMQLQQALTSLYFPYSEDERSISFVEQAIDVYRKLVKTDPQRFSPYLIRLVFAHAFIYFRGKQKDSDAIVIKHDDKTALRDLFDIELVEYSNPYHYMDHDAFTPGVERLGQSSMGVQVVQEVLYAYLTLENEKPFITHLAEEMDRMMIAFASHFPDIALEAIQRATSHVITLGDLHQYILLRILALLNGASRRVDAATRLTFSPHAEIVVGRARSKLFDSDLCKALQLHGLLLINLGKVKEGIALLDEAVAKYRALSSDSFTILHEFLATLEECGAILLDVGETVKGLEYFLDAVTTHSHHCTGSSLDEESQSTYVRTLLRIAHHLLSHNLVEQATMIAACVYDHISGPSLSSAFPYSFPPTLLGTFIQLLRLAGREADATLVASDATTALRARIGDGADFKTRLQGYELLIHWYAICKEENQLSEALDQAYALAKDKMGGDLSPTALGLRPDTLAIIASHYASSGRLENVLPFASAAVEALRKAASRNNAEDMQYFKSICDVAAFLWNDGRRIDAEGLLDSVADAWKERLNGALDSESNAHVLSTTRIVGAAEHTKVKPSKAVGNLPVCAEAEIGSPSDQNDQNAPPKERLPQSRSLSGDVLHTHLRDLFSKNISSLKGGEIHTPSIIIEFAAKVMSIIKPPKGQPEVAAGDPVDNPMPDNSETRSTGIGEDVDEVEELDIKIEPPDSSQAVECHPPILSPPPAYPSLPSITQEGIITVPDHGSLFKTPNRTPATSTSLSRSPSPTPSSGREPAPQYHPTKLEQRLAAAKHAIQLIGSLLVIIWTAVILYFFLLHYPELSALIKAKS